MPMRRLPQIALDRIYGKIPDVVHDDGPEKQPSSPAKPTRLEVLQKKYEQTKARAEVLKARERSRVRKENNRRNYLYGVALESAERAGLIDHKMLHDMMDKYIKADRDRRFLGLEPRGDVTDDKDQPRPSCD